MQKGQCSLACSSRLRGRRTDVGRTTKRAKGTPHIGDLDRWANPRWSRTVCLRQCSKADMPQIRTPICQSRYTLAASGTSEFCFDSGYVERKRTPTAFVLESFDR